MAIHYKGFHPYLHQRAVIDELRDAKGTNKTVVVKSSRQKGKTSLIANLLLFYSLNYKKTKNFCLSPTLKQAKSIFKTITEALGNTGVMKGSNATDLEIWFINGSSIYFKSAEQKEALRGYTADFLCIDEACFISDDIFWLILPWVDARKSPILMCSTPYLKEGFFWTYYNYGLEKTHNTVTVDWCDERFKEDIEKILPPDKLEEYRLVLPKNQFKSEYLGEWLDTDGQVFTGFRECIKVNSIQPSDRLFIGIDWANGTDNDDTAISFLNQDGKQVFLAYWNNLSPTQQIDKIYECIKPYEQHIVSIEPELNSIGTPYTDLLKQRLRTTTRSKVNGFNSTNSSKADAVAKLQVAFEQGKIEILDDDKQTRELSIYAADYNPKTKVVSYNAPSGLHDDLCIALMLSYDALTTNKSGAYGIGFATMTKK